MKVGRTSQEEIQSLADILSEIRNLSHLLNGNHGWTNKRLDDIDFSEEGFEVIGKRIRTADPEEFLSDLTYYITRLNWERILLNCSVMLEQCTDPEQDTLDHSAEIREGLALLEAKRSSSEQGPKVFLTRFNGAIRAAFRIGNQTFSLDRAGGEKDDLEHANWQANMLRSAFKQERKPLDEDPLLSMFNNNEPIDVER